MEQPPSSNFKLYFDVSWTTIFFIHIQFKFLFEYISRLFEYFYKYYGIFFCFQIHFYETEALATLSAEGNENRHPRRQESKKPPASICLVFDVSWNTLFKFLFIYFLFKKSLYNNCTNIFFAFRSETEALATLNAKATKSSPDVKNREDPRLNLFKYLKRKIFYYSNDYFLDH